jgi:2-oxoglutarate dehydrogenase complex dehydrogenase (E1) component-like enzyme
MYSQLRPTTVKDLLTAIRDYFNDFQIVNMEDIRKNMGEKLKFVRRMEDSIQIISN